jgi:Leucine-rich repeat (LRR) protein
LYDKLKNEREEFVYLNDKFLKKLLIHDELYLQFDRSELDFIEENTFIAHKRLICLDLFMNNLQYIEANTFNGLSNLECLILNDNKISQIHSDSFKCLTNLTDLYLDSNQLNKLNKFLFDGLSSLQKLSLAHNQIEKIENFGKFGNNSNCLENLIYLNLNENKITTIESNTFKSKINLVIYDYYIFHDIYFK